MVSEKLTRSQRPDARLFRQLKEGTWISNKSYKTKRGAEVYMLQITQEHIRRDVDYRIVKSRILNEYFVLATNSRLQMKVEGE